MFSKKYAKLDNLLSEFIRKRAIQRIGGCERCLTLKQDILKENGSVFPTWKQLQCSHFWGRRKLSTRFNEENAAGLCGACHLYFTENPQEHYEWFKKRLGEERFEFLNMQAQTPQKVDVELMTIYLKAKLRELEGEAND